MIAEFGLFSLVIALFFSFGLVIIPGLGVLLAKPEWEDLADRYTMAQFLFVGLSWLALTICFVNNDFTVRYVLANSSRSLPWFYKICAVWGGHEGSMLLWVLVLSFWMLLVSMASRHLPREFRVRVLVILGLLSAGLLLFLLSVSNPFLRQFQLLQTDGKDLNPLLQDPGFLFHPPMLYMGYVGFSVAFAMAIATLWLGKIESQWAKWCRPWTLAAWCCLTIGITLGSWWAYRELGWGGWWFWDPVENASFMPWLAGTALIHSLAVNEYRSQFKAWTLLLAITAFSLSLIGTFLVRSGVLTSVHAFAVDPQRGMYILGFLILVIGGSLSLFAFRAHTLGNPEKPNSISRESFLLLNNIILATAMLTVLMGTVYPLLIDALGLGKLSVGAPYFNTVFVPLMLPLFVLMGLGMHVKWQQDSIKRIILSLKLPLLLSGLVLLLLLSRYKFDLSIYAILGFIIAAWVIFSSFLAVMLRIQSRGFRALGIAFSGMICAHVGVGVTIIGITASSVFGQMQDVRMSPGSTINFAGFKISFQREQELDGPNYHAVEGVFTINNGKYEKIIYPQKRIYKVGQMAMTDSAIDANPFRDVYVALGEPLGNASWSVRLYFKPLVRWIWAGGFLMLIGGLLALSDRRYYRQSKKITITEEISL